VIINGFMRTYAETFYYYFDVAPPLVNDKLRWTIQSLIKEQGEQTFLDLVEFTCSRWKDIKKELHINSYPTMSFIYGYRYTLLDLMRNSSHKGVRYKKVERKSNSSNNSVKRNTKEAFFNR